MPKNFLLVFLQLRMGNTGAAVLSALLPVNFLFPWLRLCQENICSQRPQVTQIGIQLQKIISSVHQFNRLYPKIHINYCVAPFLPPNNFDTYASMYFTKWPNKTF